jgi:hypothetical protein
MAQNWTLNTDSMAEFGASDCIERIRSSVVAAEFGYKVQALAAHVLLRLGYRIDAVNQSGHPDIVAIRGGTELRFEVEAEVIRPRLRKLTEADFASLLGPTNARGYYALVIAFPSPKWILVPASKLVGRTLSSPNMLLEAISDKEYSLKWTREYTLLLHQSCRQIRLTSFSALSEMAIGGRRL